MPVAVTNIGTATSSSGATVILAVPGTIPAGSLILVSVTEKSTSGTNGTIADTQSNTYNTAISASLNAAAASGRGMVFYVFNSKALTNTDTITYTKNLSGSICAVSACWVSGVLNGADPRDTGAQASATGSTGTITVTSNTAAEANEIFFGVLCDSGTSVAGGNATFTQAGSFSTPLNEANTGGSGNARVNGGNQRNATTGTLTYNPTLSSTAQTFAVFIVSFKTVPDSFITTKHTAGVPDKHFEPRFPVSLRTWTKSYPLYLQNVPARYDYGTPPPAEYPVNLRFWAINNLLEMTLRSQDKMVTGKQVTDLPPPRYVPPPLVPSWAIGLNTTTLAGVFPPGEQLYDLPPRGPAPLVPSWAINLQQSTLFAPSLPPGEQIFDLTPSGPAFSVDLRRWINYYNLNLVAQDQLPVGEQVTELPPRGYFYPFDLRTWINSYKLTLIGQDALPVGDQLYQLAPTGYFFPYDLRKWTDSFKLTLIAQDRLPVGVQSFELPPRAPPRLEQTWVVNLLESTLLPLPPGKAVYDLAPRGLAPIQQTWLNPLNPALSVVQFPLNQYDWPVPRAPLRIDETWTQSLNPNFFFTMPLPPDMGRPEPIYYPPALRTWTQSLTTTTLAPTQTPFAQYDWPVPRGYIYPNDLRSWLNSYKLTLVAQDQLPVGEQLYALAPIGPPRLEQTWLLNLQQSTFATIKPFAQYDWPNPRAPLRIDETWLLSLNQTTLAPLPPGEQYFDRPPLLPPFQNDLRTWVNWYKLTLVGQDAFPPGKQTFALAPIGPPRLEQTWWQNLILSTLAPRPFAQYDWPLPGTWPPQAYPRTWLNWYNLNLIAQDALPVGEQFTDLGKNFPLPNADNRTWIAFANINFYTPPPPPTNYDWPLPIAPYRQPDLRTWTFTFNPNLVGKDQLPTGKAIYETPTPPARQPDLRTWLQFANLKFYPIPFNQTDWPVPRGYFYPPDLRTWLLAPPVIFNPAKPLAQYDWPLPRAYPYPNDLRSWAVNLQETTLASVALPPGIAFTALPPQPIFPIQLRTWSASFPLTLVGQDRLPVGKQTTDLVPRPYAFSQELRSWVAFFNQNLSGQDQLPVGEIVTELTPRPYPYPPQTRTWTFSFPLTLSGQDRLPTGKQVTDLPPPPKPPDLTLRSWLLWLNETTLRGQDKFPAGRGLGYDWPPPRGYPPLLPYYTPQILPLTFSAIKQPPLQACTTVTAGLGITSTVRAMGAQTTVSVFSARTTVGGPHTCN